MVTLARRLVNANDLTLMYKEGDDRDLDHLLNLDIAQLIQDLLDVLTFNCKSITRYWHNLLSRAVPYMALPQIV